MGACRSSEEEDNIDQESHSRQQSNFYNILAFGDQAHDRFAFFTAAHNAIRRRQTEACRQPQQPQQPPEHLPRFLELEDISTLACGTVHPAQASRPTCSNAAVTTVPVRRDQEVSRRLQGTSPLLQASDVLASRFEVVVDFDSAQLQQQVNDSRPDQGSVRVPSALPTQAQSTTAASVATASAMATAAAVTAARAAATAAAARGAAPAADLSSPVEAVLAASAMAARAAATVAASAADVFAVTTATRGVEAGVEADLIPLPPEAEEQNRHRTRSELLTRRTHLAEHFAEWRRVVTEGREATKTASEAGGDMETDSVNCFQTRAAQVHQVAQPRRSSEEDARRTTAMGHFTLRTTTEELDAFGYMEEKLLRKRNSRRGSSRK
ncbi:conserved hypothetical protein [Neospora caninum Liverpool]|uniref:Uncharacterized protein n=1 Tax=Neospora caninum (strain Liverpool) TaxID=572307 RepID=F0V8R8_NEOCL|nr:conserved hypothetical protein [Neospora caninum Liverpool]CBZ50109.1 conserved hypothetical protein [Neospora caninum Liverpool]|eukprot:XP_003880144.1 conserved hypothetical protein [Neospora caninum Liverpool]